ncbi:MAG: reverse transcriptase domain-containing protein [Alphaproteobacteria bacterium]
MKQGAGIPQGTPISATFSNLYMTDFDCKVRDICNSMGAFYRRYSDDILIICPSEISVKWKRRFPNILLLKGSFLAKLKQKRTLFNGHAVVGNSERSAQYLGFCYYPGGAGLRPSSLSNQWRKMKRGIKKAKKAAQASATMGKIWEGLYEEIASPIFLSSVS